MITFSMMTKQKIWELISHCIFLFFLASVLGFLWEVAIFLVREGQLFNRGFLYGPWLPVYGIGAVFFFLLLRNIRQRPVLVFFSCMAIGTLLELLIGWFLDVCWGLSYWDYSGSFLHFKGYICLWSALGFGIAGLLWVCLFSRFALFLYKKMPVRWQHILNTLLVLAFAVDCAAALIFPNQGTGVTF